MTNRASILADGPVSGVSPTASGGGGGSALERLEVLDAEGRDLIGLWHNVLVLALRQPPTASTLRRIGVLQEEVAARFPDGYAALAILPNLQAPFSRELRAEAVALTSATPPQLLGVAEVIEGTGFVAASVRSIATGLVLLARPRWPMRVFPSVEPAAAWVTQWVERDLRAGAPRRMVEALRHTLA